LGRFVRRDARAADTLADAGTALPGMQRTKETCCRGPACHVRRTGIFGHRQSGRPDVSCFALARSPCRTHAPGGRPAAVATSGLLTQFKTWICGPVSLVPKSMSLIQAFPIAFACVLTALAVQAVLLLRLMPGRLIGDEKDYVGADVATRDLWVRVPLHRIMMRAVDRLVPGPAFPGPRVLNALISVLSVGVAVAFVETNAGAVAACVTGLLLLISLERAILALHLWPDIAIGLIIAAVALLWAHPSPSNAVWAAGVASVGFALRVECAVLVVLTAILPFAVPDVAGLHQVAPGLVALCGVVLLSLYARIHRGTWWPDTTLFFNLAVARTELTLQARRRPT